MKAAQAVQLIQKVLQGSHPVDEQILSSLNYLERQMENLKKKSALFEKIGFSEQMEHLLEQAAAAAAH